jgi:alpha-tubulin suppressor-like RCC1 family protein
MRLKQVAAGSDHSVFLTDQGKVILTGSNEHGQQLKKKGNCSELTEIEFPHPIK